MTKLSVSQTSLLLDYAGRQDPSAVGYSSTIYASSLHAWWCYKVPLSVPWYILYRMWSVLPLINLIFLRLLCSSEVGVYAYAAAQVKKAMEVGVYSYITLRGYIVYFVHLDYSYIDLSSDNCFICCFVHPIGDTLSRGRKLCILGWSWGLSITLEHRYGKRAWSSGMFVRHFLLWYSGKLCFSMWALVSFMLLKRFTLCYAFFRLKVFAKLPMWCPSPYQLKLLLFILTGKISWSCCCLQEEDWIQW